MAKSIQQVIDEVAQAAQSAAGGGFVRNSNGTQTTNAGVGYQNQYGTSYVQLIAQIYQMFNSGASFEDILKQMSVQGDGMNGGQVDDLNKQLLDQALNLGATKENRQYNESLRDEQRLYDNPQNQLARLMGAGIGRDAAIAMLSGGSGSGGSGVPYSDTAAAASSAIPATQSTLNNAQTAQAYASIGMNAVFGSLSAISGLVDLGLSVPQAIQQIGIMKNQKYLTDQQRGAYDVASRAFTVLNSAGVENAADVFGSIAKTVDTINELAEGGNAAAKSFIDSGGVDQLRRTSPFSAPFLNQLYRNERDSSDYAASFRAGLDNTLAQTDLAKANRDYLEQGVKNLSEQIENLRADQRYKDALTALTGKQQEYVEQEIIALTNENTKESAFLNGVINGKTGLELYVGDRLNRLYSDVMELTYLNNQEAWTKKADSILADYKNAQAVLELSALYANGAITYHESLSESDKAVFYLARGMHESHLPEYVSCVIDAETSGRVGGNGFSTSTPAYRALELITGYQPEETPLYKRWFDHIRQTRAKHREQYGE